MKNKIAYIAHPISGNIEDNLADLRRIIRSIAVQGEVIPFSPYYAIVCSLDDTIPHERDLGISFNSWIIQTMHIDYLYLTGTHISPGMQAEMELAVSEGIIVKNLIGKI